MNKPASELIALDKAGLDAAVRECARITAPEISDEEYEKIVAEDSLRYRNTRLDMERTILAYLSAANQSGSERAGVDRAKLAEWADDFEAAAHEVPRGIKSTILMTRAQEVRAALATPPAQPAPEGGESCANSILRAIWDDIETAAVETPVDNYECADIRPETLARLADHLAARNWKDKADVDLPPDDCRTAILPISVRGRAGGR